MKIIIYGLNFKPEIVGTGKYSGELADYLYKKGHNLKVITAPKYYPEWEIERNNYYIEKNSLYKIFRCPLYVPKSPNGLKRILHLFSFSISSLPVLMMQLIWKPDCIILIAPTLLCAPNIFIFKLFSFKKILTMIQIKDFEVEAAFNLGILKGKIIKKILSKFEFLLINIFTIVGTISYQMINKLNTKGIKRKKVYYFPDWVDLNKIKQKKFYDVRNNIYRKKLNISSETIIIQYSGTMNRKQGFDFLLPIIESFKDSKNVLWLFGGEGPTKKEFMKKTKKIKNLIFLPFQEEKDINHWLNTGDIHIIPQNEDVDDLLFPSKLLGILASGNPIVSNTSKNSDLGKIVEIAGIRVDPKDKIGFINALNILIKDNQLRINLGSKAREIAHKRYSKKLVLEEFNRFLECMNNK